MNLLYVSGHRFIKCANGDLYTTGQMGEKYFYRFKGVFEHVTVIGFYENENEGNALKKVEIVNKNIEFLDYLLVEGSNFPVLNEIFTAKKISRLSKSLIRKYDRVATKAPSLVACKAVGEAKKNRVSCYVELV